MEIPSAGGLCRKKRSEAGLHALMDAQPDNTRPVLGEEIRANGLSINGDALYDIADPSAEFETRVLEKAKMDDFKSRLSETDQRILELRAAGYSQKEIAERVDFKVPSAVSKRIRQVANRFDDFVSKEYGEFIDKHIE